jgi:serine protease Do
MTGFGEVAERLRRSTVQVLSRGTAQAGGSGVIATADGIVLTNHHVVTGTAAEVKLWNGDRIPAKLTGRDRQRDLAALQITASSLRAAELASACPRVGELVGFVGAVSTGVVHANGPLPGLGPLPWVQSDVRLAPGSSGGPLANASGEVLGLNTMIVGRGGFGNLALAIPIAAALRFLHGHDAAQGVLGVTVRPVQLPNERALGFLILETTTNEAADRASLMIGDVLMGAEGRTFARLADLQEALHNARDGRVSLQFRRGGSSRQRTVVIQLNSRRAAA